MKKAKIYNEERMKNIYLSPPKSQKSIDIDLIKEQVIDLNDKLDYLVTILMKNRKIGVRTNGKNDNEIIIPALGDNPNILDISLDITQQLKIF